jgi:methylated-DNA-[protein]-cysteine S-methyltransferase
MSHYALFETALGWAGIAWTDSGLAAVHLPEYERESSRAGLLRKAVGAREADLPVDLADTVARINELLSGAKPDLTAVPLDMAATPEFDAKVYEIARAIPPGETLTYGAVAEQLGDRLLAREVGAALGRNPWPIVVPCHRVTAADGKLGGFSARGGAQTKHRLLAIEGAAAAAQGDLFG